MIKKDHEYFDQKEWNNGARDGFDPLARDRAGDEQHKAHGRRGKANGEVHAHDDGEMDRVHAEVDERLVPRSGQE